MREADNKNICNGVSKCVTLPSLKVHSTYKDQETADKNFKTPATREKEKEQKKQPNKLS